MKKMKNIFLFISCVFMTFIIFAPQLSTYAKTSNAIITQTSSYLFSIYTINTMLGLFSLSLLLYLCRIRRRLITLAYFDELTGLINMNKFKKESKKILESNKDKTFAIYMIDISNFNLINEHYGFNVGDLVLRNMAKTLTAANSSRNSLVARISDDTFIWLDEFEHSLKNPAPTFREMTKLYKTKFKNKFFYQLGRYIIPKGNVDINSIYEHVNYAHSYAKKNSIKNEITDYDNEVKLLNLKARRIESIMDVALAKKEFAVFLQGKYSSDGTQLVGAEALVRWYDTNLGTMYSPVEFIPLFEENGFITQLDLYMFEETCKYLSAWKEKGLTLVPISINFSRLHFQTPGLADVLYKIACKYHIEPHYLDIEITENSLSIAFEDIAAAIINLQQKGFLISMDDFSSKNSSLSLLSEVFFDTIKLDREFVHNIANNDRCCTLVAGTIAILKELNIEIVAEGIETKEQAALIASMNCNIIQGYVYARPIHANEFEKLLSKAN